MSSPTVEHQSTDRFWGLQRSTWALLLQRVKIAAPVHVAVLVLTALVLIHPVASAIGRNAFLVIVYLTLFFYPQGTVGAQVQNVLVNITVCAFGQAITFLTVCGAVWIDGGHAPDDYNTDRSKSLGACVLVFLCFAGGVTQSLYPRMKAPVRILLFSSTWTITSGANTIQSTIFTDQFYPAALAAAVSLLAGLLVFPRSATKELILSLVRVFSLQQSILDQTIKDFFELPSQSHAMRKPSPEYLALRKTLLAETSMLKTRFETALLDISNSRVSIADIRPLLPIVHRTTGWISCGMGLGTRESREGDLMQDVTTCKPPGEEKTAPMKSVLDAFHPTATTLHNEVTSSIRVIQASIELTMRGGSPTKFKHDARWDILYRETGPDPAELPGLHVLRRGHELNVAIEAFKGELAIALEGLAHTTKPSITDPLLSRHENVNQSQPDIPNDFFRSDICDVAFLMVSLMEIAMEVSIALTVCHTLITTWRANSKKKVWWSGFNLGPWFEMSSSPENVTEAIYDHDVLQKERHDMELLTREESRVSKSNKTRKSRPSVTAWLHEPGVIRRRITLSRFFHSLTHNIHIRFALKLAGGVALLSLPAWLSHVRPWFEEHRGLWAIVTYIYVLETSTGATIRISLYRAIATIAGALWALIAWYISGQGNRYSIAFFIVLAQVPSSYLVLFSKKTQSMGLVFGYTQSIIVLVPLMPVQAGQQTNSVAYLGLLRGYQILMGIAAAFLVNTFVWPLHARVYLIRNISYITSKCSAIYLNLAGQMFKYEKMSQLRSEEKDVKWESNVRSALAASREYLDLMQSEWSLIPKPTQILLLVTKALQRLADLLVLLRKCRKVALVIIRRDESLDLLNLRQELVSSVLLNLWVVGQSLRTREKLPQFIPSCRLALHELTNVMSKEISQQIFGTETSDRSAMPTTGTVGNDGDHSHDHNSLHVSPPSIFLTPRRRSPVQSGQTTPKSAHAMRRRPIDHSYIYLFAEHTLLSEIIFEVEKLQFLAKLLVGENSFIDDEHSPGESAHGDDFDIMVMDDEDFNAYQQGRSSAREISD